MTRSPASRRPPQLNRIYVGDALTVLRTWPDEFIDICLCSPPYWALRDYGVDGQIGLEATPQAYIDRLLEVFDEVRRVLKPTGTCWINLADTYMGSWAGYKAPSGGQQKTRPLRPETHWPRRGYDETPIRPPSSYPSKIPKKCLCLHPERFALGMLDRGWILRNKVIWHKPNHMPASTKDRFSCSWEYLFFFAKQARYCFNLDAVRIPHKTLERPANHKPGPSADRPTPSITGRRRVPKGGEPGSMHPKGKNPGDFYSVPAETRTWGAILGKSGAVKVPGGAGWTGHPTGGQARIAREQDPRWLSPHGKNPGDCWEINTCPFRGAHFAVYPEKLCEQPIRAACPPNGIVLDPFAGAGTTLVVAKKLGRALIGIDLNPDYVHLARHRLSRQEGRRT